MIFRNLIFEPEVVKQRLRAGMVSHHEQQASKCNGEQQHRELWPAYNLNIAPPQASTEGLFQQTRLFTSTIPSGDFKTSFPRRIALVCYSCGRFHLSRKDCAKRVAAIPGEPASRQLSEFVPIRFDCGARF